MATSIHKQNHNSDVISDTGCNNIQRLHLPQIGTVAIEHTAGGCVNTVEYVGIFISGLQQIPQSKLKLFIAQ